MPDNNEKLLGIAYVALSMIDETEYGGLEKNWLEQAQGTVQAIAMITRKPEEDK